MIYFECLYMTSQYIPRHEFDIYLEEANCSVLLGIKDFKQSVLKIILCTSNVKIPAKICSEAKKFIYGPHVN